MAASMRCRVLRQHDGRAWPRLADATMPPCCGRLLHCISRPEAVRQGADVRLFRISGDGSEVSERGCVMPNALTEPHRTQPEYPKGLTCLHTFRMGPGLWMARCSPTRQRQFGASGQPLRTVRFPREITALLSNKRRFCIILYGTCRHVA